MIEGIQHVSSIIAGMVMFLGILRYIKKIWQGKIQPAIVTWIIWTTLDTITAVGMYYSNTLNGQMVGTIIGCWISVGLVLRYGTRERTRIDISCLVGATLAILLWWQFNSPLVGVLVSLATTFTGSIPTFISVWHKPSNEDPKAWFVFLHSSVFAIVGTQTWTLESGTQPFTFFVIQAIVVYLLYVRSKRLALI